LGSQGRAVAAGSGIPVLLANLQEKRGENIVILLQTVPSPCFLSRKKASYSLLLSIQVDWVLMTM